MRQCLAFAVVFLLLVGCTFSQQMNHAGPAVVPRLIRFTGQLQDGGHPVAITFTLHKGQRDATVLWTETQNIQLAADGKYTVLLGATKAEGMPMELFTSGEAQWLGIRVEGQPEQPRVLLVSVPYAMKAAEAETLAGHAATEFVTAEKLNSTVQEQLRQQSAGSSPVKDSGPTRNGSVVNSGATNFADTTSGQVVLVTQNGTGSAIVANSVSKYAIQANSNTGGGLYAASAGNAAIAAYNTSTTGTAYGVLGSTKSTSGVGFRGTAAATSGNTSGVMGDSASPTGIGVFGTSTNTGTTAAGVGVYGRAAGGTGTGVRAVSANPTGATTGLLATVLSAAGTTAVLQNTAGGKLISGQSGTSNTEVFSVSGGGTGTFTGAGDPVIVGDMGCFPPSSGVSFGPPKGCTEYTLLQQNADLFVNRPTGGTLHFRQENVEQLTLDSAGNVFAGGAEIVLGADGRVALGENQDVLARIAAVGSTTTIGLAWEGGIFQGGPGISFTDGGRGLEAIGGDAPAAGGGIGLAAFGGLNGDGTTHALAAAFSGDIQVTGNVTAPVHSFTIDHPLDPANRYLQHASVESSELKDMYDGTVTTDAHGRAVVLLPDWFEAVNGDFRYQLTVMGEFAQAIVAKKIADHRFTIRTDKPNVEVSWMVTGVRRDPYAAAHPLQVEMDKDAREKGKYLHPELYGEPEEKTVEFARRPSIQKRVTKTNAADGR